MGKFWTTGADGKPHRTKAGIKHEHDKFQSSPKARKDHTARVTARRKAVKLGLVSAGDGRVIDHKDSNPRNNSRSNFKVMSRSENAGKTENSRRKGSKRNKRTWGK